MTAGERVAVEVGTAALRVAAADAGGAAVLIADLPGAGPATPHELPRALVAVTPARPAELVLVHPARWPAARVAAWVTAAAPAALRVRAMPVPAAVAAPGRAVLDVGRTGAEASLLGPDGRVRAVRWCPAGGDALDAAVVASVASVASVPGRGARRTRETLSLLPAAPVGGGASVQALALRPALAEVLRPAVAAVAALTTGPVVLVGGVARTPLLAELLDDAGIGPVTVAPRPDTAAVLGAVRGPRPPGVRPAPAATRPALLPPTRRPRRALLCLTTAAAAAAMLAVPAARPQRGPAAPAPGVLVQYGYELRVPPGWAHTGGLPERRRSVLTPAGAPAGSDLVAVERTPLGYDADAEPERAVAELRAAFDAAAANGAAVSGFDAAADLAGRPVVGYRQVDAPGVTAVDWYVVLDGDAQLSVGCRHTPAGRAAVAGACAVVVASLRRSR